MAVTQLQGLKDGDIKKDAKFTRLLAHITARFQLPDVHLFPIGRLDKDTTGLLLVTNDGDLASLATTKHTLDKEYLCTCYAMPSDAKIAQLKSGVELRECTARASHVEVVSVGFVKSKPPYPDRPVAHIKLVIATGQFRVVRRMMAAVGLPVTQLERIRIGPFLLSAFPIPNKGLQSFASGCLRARALVWSGAHRAFDS
eukprot:m.204094 g.204094  ORF g.204094 m.204094 type:complete len:199 (-) comp53861_c0_seq1:22-618(-)